MNVYYPPIIIIIIIRRVYTYDEYARLFMEVAGSVTAADIRHTSHTHRVGSGSGESPPSGGLGRGHQRHTPGLSIIKSSP